MSNTRTGRLQMRKAWIFVTALLVTTGMAMSQTGTTTTTSVAATGPLHEYPKAEVDFGYSFVNVHPDLQPITSFNVNGGGAAFVYNASRLIGIKAEFMDYTGGGGAQLRALGFNGNVSGNIFTYLFGPQVKKHSGRFQPFGEALFGAAHSGTFADIYNEIHGISAAGNSNNSFAMELGGGIDIPVTKHIAIRPVEVDYLLTRFGAQNYSASQNNFRYMVGVNIGIGGK
jgi:opacity protein-like surface antigen